MTDARERHEALTRRVDGWVRVACLIVLPAMLLGPFWPWLNATVGSEISVGLAVALQILLVWHVPWHATPHIVRLIEKRRARPGS